MATTVGLMVRGEHGPRVVQFREQLATAAAVTAAPMCPHVTLAVATDLDANGIDATLAGIASDRTPFVVRVRGAALVRRDGDSPVVYLPVVRSEPLEALHRAIVEAFGVDHTEGHYRSDTWIPHLTVWRGPVTAASLEVVSSQLAAVSWNVPVTDLSRFADEGVAQTFGLGTGEIVEPFEPMIDAVGRSIGWARSC